MTGKDRLQAEGVAVIGTEEDLGQQIGHLAGFISHSLGRNDHFGLHPFIAPVFQKCGQLTAETSGVDVQRVLQLPETVMFSVHFPQKRG